jgi:hypothetical protein
LLNGYSIYGYFFAGNAKNKIAEVISIGCSGVLVAEIGYGGLSEFDRTVRELAVSIFDGDDAVKTGTFL